MRKLLVIVGFLASVLAGCEGGPYYYDRNNPNAGVEHELRMMRLEQELSRPVLDNPPRVVDW
ncbi:MAG: hypothetical protein LLG01_00845 [Planctomycetaceae bacterium]|nr:hypothetical protein [Planctomycetaceae bacterium]